jgi:hypothetical protein
LCLEESVYEGKHYSIKRVDGQITELTVNGTAIPRNQYGDYSEVIGQIDEAQRQRILKRKEDVQLRKKDFIVKQKEMREKRKELAVANQKELGQRIELKKEMQVENNLKREQDRKLFEQKNELRKAEYKQKKAEIIQNKKLFEQKKAVVMQREKMFKQERMRNDDITRIISDLGNQKLASNADDLSFSLTNDELIVNGTKQPSEIQQQFKEKYIQNSGDRFNYSKKGNTTSITINKE